jgi:hypothetical protein
MDLKQLYQQHPVAFIGVAGGGALLLAYVVSSRGKSNNAVAPYPVSAYGTQGQGYTLPGGIPLPVPCWVSGDCPEPLPNPTPLPVPDPACLPGGGFGPGGRVIPDCGHPRPLPPPEGPQYGGVGGPVGGVSGLISHVGAPLIGGFGRDDYSYAQAWVDARERTRMHIGMV